MPFRLEAAICNLLERRPRKSSSWALALLFLIGTAFGSEAATLYKLTDRRGKVTYSQTVPQGFDGRVTRLAIDAIAPAPEAKPAPHVESEYEEIIHRRPPPDPKKAAIEAARRKAEAARKAYEEARDNSSPEDWIYLGAFQHTAIHRVMKPEYEERLKHLEEEAKKAEEDLERVEREG